MGDPMELRIHSYELTLRLADAEKIEIENVRDVCPETSRQMGKPIPHPGLGEEGKYHDKEKEDPLPDQEVLTFALAGNQNCGKTTLFNQLTGSNQHVGNFPGVTVDRKGRSDPWTGKYAGNGSAGHLFDVPIFQRRGCDEKLSAGGAPKRNYQYRGCDK